MSTRLIWMSWEYASRPSPTVNTGTPAACSGKSVSSMAPSALSAPSVTSTRPDSGTPDSSSQARVRAWPTSVRVPSWASSPIEPTRSVRDEKPKSRTANRSRRAEKSGLSSPSSRRMTSARDSPSTSAICMLRESSTRIPRKFCWGSTCDSTRTGRHRQTTSRASTASRMPVRTPRSTGRLFARTCR